MFQSPGAPASPPPPAPPAPAGEFTRQFESPPPALGNQPLAPPPMPAGVPPPNRMTMVDVPAIPASAFEPNRPAGFQPAQPPRPAASGMTVEFNRLFDEPKSQAPPALGKPNQPQGDFARTFGLDQNAPRPPQPPQQQQQPPPRQASMTVEFNRLFEPGSGDPRASQPQAPTGPPQPQQPVGEFTRMFQSGQGTPPQQQQPQGQQGPPPPPPAAKNPPKPGGYVTAREGESTQMFQAPTRAPLPPAPPRQGQPQQMQQPPSGGPPGGEFTQMFQRPNQGAPLPPSGAPAGEFTRQFMNPMANPSGGASNYQMPALPPQPMGPPPPQKVNEFEELFGGVKAQQRPGPPQPAFGGSNAGGGLSATASFSIAPSGSTPAPQAAPMSSPLSPAAGGNSYTQFMKAPGPAEPFGLGMQQPKGPAAPPPPTIAQKKGIPPIVWIAGGLLIFLIVAIVIVFAFMKK
jgi:hypothetical protein